MWPEPSAWVCTWCGVAIAEDGAVRSAGRVQTKPQDLELFAQSLGPGDRVALEVTGNAWEIARILEPHVARVVVVSPSDTGIRQARAKSDRLDARTLAKLLASGELDAVWMPDRATWVMRRRLSRRGQLVWARSRAKNEIDAVLMRCLIGRAPTYTRRLGPIPRVPATSSPRRQHTHSPRRHLSSLAGPAAAESPDEFDFTPEGRPAGWEEQLSDS